MKQATSVLNLVLLVTGSTLLWTNPSAGDPGSMSGATISKASDVDPADFTHRVDHSFFPLRPGSKLTYVGKTQAGTEVIEDIVTEESKTILGVRTTVVINQVKLDGKVIEITRDWYAQDREGNVWYFGEDSLAMKDGYLTRADDSWEAGVDGALPGIIMPAHPQPGDEYEQERAPARAEDRGRVESLEERVSVPYGTYRDCLEIREVNPLEPGKVEYKYFARGVGLVLEIEGEQRVELITVSDWESEDEHSADEEDEED